MILKKESFAWIRKLENYDCTRKPPPFIITVIWGKGKKVHFFFFFSNKQTHSQTIKGDATNVHKD